MLGGILIAAGAMLVTLGAVMLVGWTAGKSTWFDSDVFDRRGSTVNDRQFVNLYFIAIVLAPLLIGGILIIFGLRELT
ncbi:MAG TPA: hypothetical protein VNA25_26555 [Phycisphaerae bacterium]|nr:hypothetical protein [Phycisphaerae bacterium]